MPPSTIIMTQLVHLDGPRRGQIDEFRKDAITIGRDPTSDVILPADLRIISRHHAELTREGNRFKLITRGRNQCLLNGQYVDQAWLKNGDVITLAEGGPKLSFLSKLESVPQPAANPAPATTSYSTPAPASSYTAPPPGAADSAPATEAAFTLQYGIQIKTLKQPSVRIGSQNQLDFVIPHPKVCAEHCQLLFSRNNYYVRDLSGTHATLVNHRVVQGDAVLQTGDIIQLGETGPQLSFMGDGRFIEHISEQSTEDNPGDWETELLEDIETHKAFSQTDDSASKAKGILSRLFKRR